MEFEGLKLVKTKFKFKSEKEYNIFFNNALIASPLRFINLTKQEFDENMHIIFSWKEITKCISFGFLFMFLFAILNGDSLILRLSILGFSSISMLINWFLRKKLNDLNFGKSFVISIYEMDNYFVLEEIRENLIKERKKIKLNNILIL